MFFWNSFAFLMIQWMLAIWYLFSLPFLNPARISGHSWFTYCWSLLWRILSFTLLACEISAIVLYFEHSLRFLFFGIGRKTDVFQSYGHCWVFQICWHIECSTFTASCFQFSSVTQSCPTLCDPMNHSTPGFPVHHKLSEFTQTHAHRVGDAIQPSHPLLSPSPPAPNPSQQQDLFQRVNSLHEVAKLLELQLQHQSFQWTPRTCLLQDELVGSPCSPRDSQESSPIP